MLRMFAVGVIAAALSVSATAADKVPVSKIVVDQISKSQFNDLISLGLDIIEAEGDRLEILARPADRQKLEYLGIPYQVEQEDLETFYAQRAAEPFGGFRTYTEILQYLDSLSTAHPNIMTARYAVDTSVEGRSIYVVKVSDNPNIDEDEPEVFYNSLIHAREPAGAAALLNVLRHLVTEYGIDTEATEIVDGRELYFMPVVNPDGYLWNEDTNPDGGGLWRKNRRINAGNSIGVDLNRNFDFKWGYDDIGSSSSSSSDVYRGAAPFSEPETQAIRDFVVSRNFSVCNNIHTYSDLFLWPYGYDRIFSHQEDFFSVLGDSLSQFNGYTAEVSWTLYPTNGAADDWMWGDTISKPRLVSITSEIGGNTDGFWPLPANIPQLEAENLGPNLFLAKIADNPYVLAPPEKSLVTVPDSVGQTFTVEWANTDLVNPPVRYALYELTNKQTVTDIAESNEGYWSTARMALSSTRKHSGSFSWKTQNANRANHWLLSQTPYTVKPGDSLVFWVWYSLELDYDYFYAQISVDGGFDFINLANNLTTNSDPNNLNVGNGITGSSGAWVRAAFALSPYVGKEVFIRLTTFTDSFSLNEGVYIDDIENVDMFGSETLIDASVADTFYTFANHAPGDHWYRVTGADAQDQVSRMSAAVQTTVYQGWLLGDWNNDLSIDISDLSMMIAYLVAGGAGPDPLASGNLNCSGMIDISDLTLMIAYLTGQISQPTCP
ncbi:MAG: immune inhibitor A [candidate division Zixibacteria bacterium]|nr:immune inhibitor A [candidate division Zixibacteria bacterium]